MTVSGQIIYLLTDSNEIPQSSISKFPEYLCKFQLSMFGNKEIIAENSFAKLSETDSIS